MKRLLLSLLLSASPAFAQGADSGGMTMHGALDRGIERPIGALVSLAVMATIVTLMLQGIGYLKRRGAI